ncbi:hypothetical protein GC176_21315 [bacterium]|nr:hypothetical protein [bacterium]
MHSANHRQNLKHRYWWNLFVSTILAAVTVVLGLSQCTAADEGEQWALLIGVEKYENVVPLQFTVNDVHQLRDTLWTYGGYGHRNVMELTDDRSEKELQPYAASLKEQLPKWLARPKAGDRVLVFFSGHGFQAADGRMYLAPLDFQKDQPEETGLSVDWLRQQIEGCKAEFKLLVIDSCHAGSEKDADSKDDNLSASALGDEFKSVEGVVTLASCKADEKSQIWREKQRSLYSYWLNEGLKGHADRDSDGRVDIDELHKYVSRRVTHTADVRFPRPQTPVRIIGPRVTGVPAIVSLNPQPLRKLLSNMAEHVANLLDEHRLARVGVLEFSDDSRLQEVLGGNFGLLGKFCGDELERQLTELSLDSDFRIVDRNQIREAMLKQGGLELADLSSKVRLVSLSKGVGDMPVMALGSIRGRDGAVLRLQCELKDTNTGDLIGITGGSAALSEDDWAMQGQSVVVRPEDRRPEFLTSGEQPRPESEQVIERLDQRVQGGHALRDPVFREKFNVQLKVNGEVREGSFRGNDYFVPVRKGDVYSVRISNNSGQLAIMRMLVDGLDTTLKVAEKGLATDLWGQPVTHLDQAGIRYLDPKGEELRGGPPVWEVMGFTTKTGTKGKIRQFEIVDAAESLAGRQGFTDQIGLITVAFYAPAGGTRGSLGTAAGQERDREILTREGPKPGNLLGVVHIRYVDADALAVAGNN